MIASSRWTRSVLLATSLLAAQSTANAAPLKVGLSFDLGGKNDGSFNQSALAGAQRAARTFDIQLSSFSPQGGGGGTVARGAEPLVGGGAQLVIGIGFSNKDDVQQSAAGHPKVKFAVVDDLLDGENTVGLRFREQEGSFMVGYIAGQSSSTGVVGFFGGQDVPLIHKFQAGFTAGVKFVCPSCKVVVSYTGKTPTAWNDPVKARELAATMQRSGADIIFAAAGASGAGVMAQANESQCLRAAELPKGVSFKTDLFAAVPKSAAYQSACAGNTRPAFYIGVDINQNALGDDDQNPATLNHGLTSMVKRVDNVAYSLIRDVAMGRPWQTGDQSYGLENGGVGYALDKYNRALIGKSLRDRLDKIEHLIVIRGIKVPTQ